MSVISWKSSAITSLHDLVRLMANGPLRMAHRTAHMARQCPVACAIAVVNLLVFVLLQFMTAISPDAFHSWHTRLSNSPLFVRDRLWLWQLLTASFLHLSVLHLLAAVLPLVWLIHRLEKSLGSVHVLLFSVCSAIFAYGIYDLSDIFLQLWDPTHGASGLLYAAAVFFVLRFPSSSVPVTDRVRLPAWWFVAGFIMLDVSWFFWPLTMPWVNRIVHLSGAVFGLLWGWGWRLIGLSSARRYGT